MPEMSGRDAPRGPARDAVLDALGSPFPVDPCPEALTAGSTEVPVWWDAVGNPAEEEWDLGERDRLLVDPDLGAGAGMDPRWWTGVAPGAALARFVQEAAPGELDDYELVEYVAAATRIEAWGHHRAALAAEELSRRESMAPAASGAGLLTSRDTTGMELSLRLGCSRRAGTALVEEGQAYAGLLRATGDALAAGRIDPGKARVILNQLRGVHPLPALAAEQIVLERAGERTHSQLAKDVGNAVVQVDPVEAAARRRAATRNRRVSAPKPLGDGMAGIWATMPAAEAQATWNSLDAKARTLRNQGDPRTLDQLRADLLVDHVLTGAASTGAAPVIATDAAVSETVLTEVKNQTDPPDPDDALAAPPVASGSATGAPGGQDGRAGADRSGRLGVPVDVRVVVPLSTLLGGDEPGELAGYGAIDPDAARALAAGGVWRRLVTDPTSGTVLDVGTTTYRPPAGLARLVRERDITCVNPRCDATADRCDLDHTVAFPAGSTAGGNLGLASRACHNAKTHAGFELEQPRPGEFVWHTPTGHTYTRPPGAPLPSAVSQRQVYDSLRHEGDEMAGHLQGDTGPPGAGPSSRSAARTLRHGVPHEGRYEGHPPF